MSSTRKKSGVANFLVWLMSSFIRHSLNLSNGNTPVSLQRDKLKAVDSEENENFHQDKNESSKIKFSLSHSGTDVDGRSRQLKRSRSSKSSTTFLKNRKENESDDDDNDTSDDYSDDDDDDNDDGDESDDDEEEERKEREKRRRYRQNNRFKNVLDSVTHEQENKNIDALETKYGYNYYQYLSGRKFVDRVCNLWHILFLFLSMCLVMAGVLLRFFFGSYLIVHIQGLPAFTMYSSFVKRVSSDTDFHFSGYIQDLGYHLITLNSMFVICSLSYMIYPLHKFTFTIPVVCFISGTSSIIEMAVININYNTGISKNEAVMIRMQNRLREEYQIKGANEFSVSYDYISIMQHHNPRPSTIVQRFKFNTRVRAQEESIRAYVAELKRLTEFCEYGDKLEEMLRDRLVCGVNDRKIQQRLLSEGNLTFAKALEIAQAMETAAGDVNDLALRTEQISVLKERPASFNRTSQKPCYRCGGPHIHSGCKFKESKCFKCQKIGHIAKVCRSSESTNSTSGSRPYKAYTLEEQDIDNEEESFALFTMFSSSEPIHKDLRINGVNIKFQVDTGASLLL
ncbi:polyprotein [Elysia marginata]|uniref:Polyprotein n=1 Tax=Elysia marginata TaxID=1093978 RepID=A0AAV4EK38_9GAST|nr:polyprotein [Elysia marginata]